MVRALLLPLLLHIAWIGVLYAWLTVARWKAVGAAEARYDDFRRADGDPPRSALIARNLKNQFELPTLAWFAALALIHFGAVGAIDVAAAWVFLAGRLIHSVVQTLTDNVRLRGIVFVINAAGVAALVLHLAWLVLAGGDL